jgi:hypothetical protein
VTSIKISSRKKKSIKKFSRNSKISRIVSSFWSSSIAKLKRDSSESARDLSDQKSSHIVSTPDLGRRVQESGSKPGKDSQNPYKRENKSDIYNSAERKRRN